MNRSKADTSALRHKQTSPDVHMMSAFLPKADVAEHGYHVRFVPKADSCTAAKGIIRSSRRAPNTTSCGGASLRENAIDVSRRLNESALSLQMHASRGDVISLGIENCDPITVVAFVAKYKLVSVMAMCAGCHRGNSILLASLEIVSVFRTLNYG